MSVSNSAANYQLISKGMPTCLHSPMVNAWIGLHILSSVQPRHMTLFPTFAVVTTHVAHASTTQLVDGVKLDKTMVSAHVTKEGSQVQCNVYPWSLGHMVNHGRGFQVTFVVIVAKSGILQRVHYVSVMVTVSVTNPVQVSHEPYVMLMSGVC